MPLDPINPAGLTTPETYSHVVVASGTRLVFVAGQAALFGDHKPTDALTGVETLAHPGCLIEVDAIAVVDER